MHSTRFRARLDGLQLEPPGSVASDDRLRGVFRAAVEPAYEHLRARYGETVLQLYGVRERMDAWVERPRTSGFGLQRGQALAALDVFHARRLALPRGLDPRASSARAQARAAAWAEHLRRRSLDGLPEAAARLLGDVAVLALVPRRWLPSGWVTAPVRATLGASTLVARARVDVELAQPHPGGLDWVRARSAEAWRELRAHLRAGRPWPIGLIDRSLDPFAARHVVAHGGHEARAGELELRVLDPAHPRMEQRLAIRLAGEAPPDEAPHAVVGFFCEPYTPATPPDDGWDRWLGRLGLRRPLWHFVRAVRLGWESMRAVLAWLRSTIMTRRPASDAREEA